MEKIFQKILSALNPPLRIGGLEISGSALRFTTITDESFSTESVQLAPGIITEGKVQDRKKFAEALYSLHEKIVPESAGKKIFCVVSIPEHTVYSQIMGLPLVAEENLTEAVELNLQMVAPGDPDTLYTDWVRLEGSLGADKKIEILGAFASREVVDTFSSVLQEQNFTPVAIESPSFSLARIATEAEGALPVGQPKLLINVSSEGIHFIIMRGESLYFNYFVSWRSIQGDEREMSAELFRKTIAMSLQRVINFWGSKQGEQRIQHVFYLTQGLEQEIESVVMDTYGIKPIRLASKRFPAVPDFWYTALGAALRGSIPRAQDVFISLMGIGTEEEFRRMQAMAFIGFWRTVSISMLLALVVAYSAADLFFAQTQNQVATQLNITANQPQVSELNLLQSKVVAFNTDVAMLKYATQNTLPWGVILTQIDTLRGQGISLNRITVQEIEPPLMVSGIAQSENIAINFKNRIAAEETMFQNVSLPLSTLRPSEDGVIFSINTSIIRSKSTK